jgi:hypothetical protein
VSSYVFPGFPAFLESASTELGHPESAGLAGRIESLTALANLCAQAAHGDPAHARGILVKAAEFRDQIAIALRAAEMMLAEVEAARDCSDLDNRAEAALPALQVPSPDPRKARKAATTPRESS